MREVPQRAPAVEKHLDPETPAEDEFLLLHRRVRQPAGKHAGARRLVHRYERLEPAVRPVYDHPAAARLEHYRKARAFRNGATLRDDCRAWHRNAERAREPVRLDLVERDV